MALDMLIEMHTIYSITSSLEITHMSSKIPRNVRAAHTQSYFYLNRLSSLNTIVTEK